MSSTIEARVGREKQRYDNKFRLIAGCIPYRRIDVEKCNTDFYNECEVLMISTPNRNDLIFPKGGWENDESVHQAACREALEEAGIKGILDETVLGVWEFGSKSKQERYRRGYMFALEVTEQLEFWPMQDTHHRKWVNVRAACELCRYEWMRDALRAFLTRIKSTKPTLGLNDMPESLLSQFCLVKPTVTEMILDSAINALS